MGAFKRLLLFIFCISAILGVGYLTLYWLSPDTLKPTLMMLADQSWFMILEIVLLGITAAGVLVVLFWAIISPSKSSRLLIGDESGGVAISREAIISTVRNTIEVHRGLEPKSIHLKIVGKRAPKMRLRAKIDPGRNIDLVSLGTELTSSITSAVETLTGYPLDRMRITFGKPENSLRLTSVSPPNDTSGTVDTETNPQLTTSIQ